MKNIHLLKNIGLYTALIICSIFLFIGGPELTASRSSYQIWDLGHIILFSLLTFLLLRDFPWLRRRTYWVQVLFILGMTAVVGIATEVLQIKLNRSPDIDDLGRNFIGSTISLFYFSDRRKEISRIILSVLQILVAAAFIRETYPLARSLLDETIARSQFPVLADFETPFESDRWQERWRTRIDDQIFRHGGHSLKILLTPAKYSGVSFKYFPHDWEGYNYFNISLYNPDKDTLRIVCRIHDKAHNNAYSDRFNRSFDLAPGWNDLVIPIEQIRRAPRERTMDIHQIELVGIFTVDLRHSRTIYIDHVYLTV
jgi:hypothetical protein